MLARAGEHAGAAASFRASLECRPGSQLTCLSLGYALRSAGLLSEATAAFEQCIQLAPQAPLVPEAQRQLAALSA